VRHEHRLDFGSELFSTGDDPVEVRAQISDHTAPRVLAGQRDGLGVERRPDLFGGLGSESR
jgi:hypothetical protein